MAHPLKVGKSVRSGPGTLLERPDLAAHIGSIVADWAHLESRLAAFYAHLMGVYLPSSDGFEPPTHPVALQVFDAVTNVHSRINLVKSLAAWVIKDVDLKKRVEEALNGLQKAATRRNVIAHSVWGVCSEEPQALIMLPHFGHQMIYKKQDFEEVSETIRVAKSTLGRVHNEFYQSRK